MLDIGCCPQEILESFLKLIKDVQIFKVNSLGILSSKSIVLVRRVICVVGIDLYLSSHIVILLEPIIAWILSMRIILIHNYWTLNQIRILMRESQRRRVKHLRVIDTLIYVALLVALVFNVSLWRFHLNHRVTYVIITLPLYISSTVILRVHASRLLECFILKQLSSILWTLSNLLWSHLVRCNDFVLTFSWTWKTRHAVSSCWLGTVCKVMLVKLSAQWWIHLLFISGSQ